MKKFFADFKKFITKGNIIDLAVAVVIGGAFSAIVNSLVNDIIMPLISLAVGGLSIADWKWVIKKAELDELGNVVKAESALHYGNFLQCILNFLIIAFCIFLVLRIIMKAKEGFDKANSDYKTQNKAEYKALAAEMKARGCTKAEIKAEIKKREAERAAAAAAEEKRKAEEAEANKPENVLLQIRDLLAASKTTDGMADLHAAQAEAAEQASEELAAAAGAEAQSTDSAK